MSIVSLWSCFCASYFHQPKPEDPHALLLEALATLHCRWGNTTVHGQPGRKATLFWGCQTRQHFRSCIWWPGSAVLWFPFFDSPSSKLINSPGFLTLTVFQCQLTNTDTTNCWLPAHMDVTILNSKPTMRTGMMFQAGFPMFAAPDHDQPCIDVATRSGLISQHLLFYAVSKVPRQGSLVSKGC